MAAWEREASRREASATRSRRSLDAAISASIFAKSFISIGRGPFAAVGQAGISTDMAQARKRCKRGGSACRPEMCDEKEAGNGATSLTASVLFIGALHNFLLLK